MVNYWGNFVKDVEKLGRDANEIIKKNYSTLSRNVDAEARRMKERVDCLNRLRELDNQPQGEGSIETHVPNEMKRNFLELIETIYKIVDSLQNIHTMCNPIDGEPHLNPGAHSTDIADLNSQRELIRNQVNSFRQLVADNNDEFAFQLAFLLKMDSVLQGRILRTICLELQNVIDQGDSGRVKQYGELAGSLLQQIDGFIVELDWNTRNPEIQSEMLPSEQPGDNNDPTV